MWNSWYPNPYINNGGKANLFEAPQQLSASRALFQPGDAFSIVRKAKSQDVNVDTNHPAANRPTFQHKNNFESLMSDNDGKDTDGG